MLCSVVLNYSLVGCPLTIAEILKNSISVIVVAAIATIAGKWFPYYRYDRCDR